jgi:exopolysaccharide biosynthesis polyprenyl glycosylphosphotransferase
MSVDVGAGVPNTAVGPVSGMAAHDAEPVLPSRPLLAWLGAAGPFLARLAIVLATTLVVLAASNASGAVIPAAIVAAIAWSLALHYVYSGAVFLPLMIGPPLTSIVAGVIGLAAASAAAMLLPAMDALQRSQLLLLTGGIALASAAYEYLQLQLGSRGRVLVIGGRNGGRELVAELRAHTELRFACLGMVDDPDAATNGDLLVGRIDDLPAVIERRHPDLIVLAGVDDRARAIERIFAARTFGFRLVELNHFYEHAFGRVPVRNVTPAWFMGLLHLYRRSYSRASKRAFDLVVTAIALVPLALLLPIVALLVRCSGRGPILFKQVRLGECGKLFEIYKFRTMVVDAERDGRPMWASADDPRITPIGRFLRRTRLDELPQLWNVLRGDMSVVGPRPERPEFLQLLRSEIPFWDRRLLVKPGITGWAQVRCGYTDDSLGAAEKLSYDLYYLKHRSLLLDVAIAAKTAATVVRGTGAR